MKKFGLTFFGLAALSIAVAAESAPSGEALGQLEGIRAVCGRLKPEKAAKYDEQLKALIGDAPEEVLAQTRKKPEYLRVYQSLLSEAGQGKNEQVIEACDRFLEMGRSPESERKESN